MSSSSGPINTHRHTDNNTKIPNGTGSDGDRRTDRTAHNILDKSSGINGDFFTDDDYDKDDESIDGNYTDSDTDFDTAGGVSADLSTESAGGVEGSLEDPKLRRTLLTKSTGKRRRITVQRTGSPILMGTSTSLSFRERSNFKVNSQKKMEKAFNSIQVSLRDIGAFKDMKFLDIKLKSLTFTVYKRDGTLIKKGIKNIRKELREARLEILRAKGIQITPDIEKKVDATIDRDLNKPLEELRGIASVEGLNNAWYKSVRGGEGRGNFVGQKSLQADNSLIQQKQCKGLKRFGDTLAVSLLEKIQDPKGDATQTKKLRREAAVKICKVEAFLLNLKKQLVGEMQNIVTTRIPAAKTPDEIQNLRELQKKYQELLSEINRDTNRYGMYAAAISKDADECYDLVCREMYEQAYAEVPSGQHRPTMEEFLESSGAQAIRAYAVDVASTRIGDTTECELFYHDHGIGLRQDHINVLVMQGFRKEPISFNAVTIGFNEEQQKGLGDVFAKTHAAIDAAKIEDNLPETAFEEDSKDPVKTRKKMKKALNTVLDKKELEVFFKDPQAAYGAMIATVDGMKRGINWMCQTKITTPSSEI